MMSSISFRTSSSTSPRRKWQRTSPSNSSPPLPTTDVHSSGTSSPSPKRQPSMHNKNTSYPHICILTVFMVFLFLMRTNSHLNKVDSNGKLEAPSNKYKVVVIGAGAAGLTAAYDLRKHGVHDVVILEALQGFGGRIQKDSTFADFPISMGGTYVYDIRAPQHIAEDVPIYPEHPSNKLVMATLHKTKFKSATSIKGEARVSSEGMWTGNNTWYDFFADYIAPKEDEENTIIYGCQVDCVDYRDVHVSISCGDQTFVTDHAIVTVPLAILQDEVIQFTPPLPEYILDKSESYMWSGFKIFIEFSKKFYSDVVQWRDWEEDGESYFWDDGKNQNTTRNILTGYIIGEPANDWVTMEDDEIFNRLMKRFDHVYDGQATKYYMKHRIINWSKNPLFRGVYSNEPKHVGIQSLGGSKIFLAGEAFPVDKNGNGWVHGAAFSGKSAAHRIIQLLTKKKVVTKRYMNSSRSEYYKFDAIVD